jgi:hydrogenase maturation factor
MCQHRLSFEMIAESHAVLRCSQISAIAGFSTTSTISAIFHFPILVIGAGPLLNILQLNRSVYKRKRGGQARL